MIYNTKEIRKALLRAELDTQEGVGGAWFSMRQVGDTLKVFIDGAVGYYEQSYVNFANELGKYEGKVSKVEVDINSPGGEVFTGIQAKNALEQFPTPVEVTISGLAASIATIIMLGGDTVKADASAMVMIHNPWVFLAGNASELRKEASLLDKMSDVMRQAYVSKTGMEDELVKAFMDDETWLTAAEAKDLGFIDSVGGAQMFASAEKPTKEHPAAKAETTAEATAELPKAEATTEPEVKAEEPEGHSADYWRFLLATEA